MNYSKIWRGYRAGDGPRFHAIWDDSSIRAAEFDGPGIDGKPATWCAIPGPGRGSLVAGRGSDTTTGPESRDFRPV